MIPISPRLLCCAAMLKGDVICDIGTDHAYLPAYLIQSGKAKQIIATDVKQGPLNSAMGTLKRFQVEQDVKLVLSDGFDKVNPKGLTDVVIAGMGGETIRDILAAPSAAFIKNNINLVLQPMTKAEVLRSWLAENGFIITRETAVKDARVYTVIQAVYTGEVQTNSPMQNYLGKLRRTDPLTKIYVAGIQERLHHKATGLMETGSEAEANEIRALLHEIDLWLNPNGGVSNDNTGHL